jgi:NAD(P)-dependent dehydrogenase (short-subunit alcohol dehydrogenase family)
LNIKHFFQSLAEELKKEKSKGDVFAVQCDVSVEDDVNRVIKWTKDNLGGVDILVNNAGVSYLSLLSGVYTRTKAIKNADIKRGTHLGKKSAG